MGKRILVLVGSPRRHEIQTVWPMNLSGVRRRQDTKQKKFI